MCASNLIIGNTSHVQNQLANLFAMCFSTCNFFSVSSCAAPFQPANTKAPPKCTDGLKVLSVCTFTCKDGYKVAEPGVTKVTCQDDDKWNKKASPCARKLNLRWFS